MARGEQCVESAVWSREEAFQLHLMPRSSKDLWILGGVYADWNAALPGCGMTGAKIALVLKLL